MTTATVHQEMLTPSEVSTVLGVSTRTLSRWRSAGRGPRAARYGHRTVRYLQTDVERWIAARAERL